MRALYWLKMLNISPQRISLNERIIGVKIIKNLRLRENDFFLLPEVFGLLVIERDSTAILCYLDTGAGAGLELHDVPTDVCPHC